MGPRIAETHQGDLVALAEYYDRAALAASQVLAGFDATAFQSLVGDTRVGVSIGATAAASNEGRALADLVVRLLARLYPQLELRENPGVDEALMQELRDLASAINPDIEFCADASAGVQIGIDGSDFDVSVYAGSSGWDALVSRAAPQPTGDSVNPLGAGAAACLAVGHLFNRLFLPDWHDLAWPDTRFSTFELAMGTTAPAVSNEEWTLSDEVVLVGAGAIGNGALWALSRAPMRGLLRIVDPQEVELSNLQRYVLSGREDVGKKKTEVPLRFFSQGLTVVPHDQAWDVFVSREGHAWPNVLVALDSAADRRAVQASLPMSLTNAWTQPGDLGVSVHGRFGTPAACLWCLYLPESALPNEDEIVAGALGIPQHVADVRTLLHNGLGVPRALLEAVSAALGLSADEVLQYENRPVRELYVEGICGGGLLPLGAGGMPRQELHVPLAHQSALAGVLLAAALVHRVVAPIGEETEISRIDVLAPLGDYIKQPARRRGNGLCICEDADYVDAFNKKYSGRVR